MNRRHSNGFAPVELIIVVVIVAVIGLVGYLVLGRGKLSGDKSPTSTSSVGQGVATGKLPVLQSLAGISFGPYDKTAGTSGDFVFSRSAADQAAPGADMLLVPFAQELCKDKATDSGCSAVTELGLNGLKLGTAVKAATAGTVVELSSEGPDYMFMTTSADYPGYAIGYSHIGELSVAEGDVVKAGQVLGKAAPYGDGGFARVGLYIKKNNTGTQTGSNKVCPLDYLDAKAEAATTPAIKQFFSDWNGFVGSKAYQLGEMRRPGCVASHTTE